MTSFAQTIGPTPFGFFDQDLAFQTEADSMVKFVKRSLGDDVLSVELTQRQIWMEFESATLEYARHVQELKIISELANVLGQSTGSTDLTNKYPQRSLDYLLRMADAYATAASVGGSYDATLGFVNLQYGKQDYDIYKDLYVAAKPPAFGGPPPELVVDTLTDGYRGKLRIVEVFHFEPLAAQTFLLNASNITNFLATNFNYESYVNSTVFYVLPVFEDVVRRGMLKEAFRVRRSNYSYQIIGSKIRIFPIPVVDSLCDGLGPNRMYIKVMAPNNVLDPPFVDDSINGISGPENVPFSILPYSTITQPGRQWIRQYTLALCRELLGIVRSKMQTIPIPNAPLTLDGESLKTQAREDKDRLTTQLKEFLEKLTNENLSESQAKIAESMMRQLKCIPMPLGKAIVIG